jgi:hypothetical protein
MLLPHIYFKVCAMFFRVAQLCFVLYPVLRLMFFLQQTTQFGPNREIGNALVLLHNLNVMVYAPDPNIVLFKVSSA